MKTAFLSFTVAAALACTVCAFAAPAQDKALTSALHKIEDNSKLVHEYAHIYDWDNVNLEVDRIVAAEKQAQKVLEGTPDAKKAEELHAAVKVLRSARLHHDAEGAVAAADKVNALAHEMMK